MTMLSSSVVSLTKLDQGCFSPQNLWTVDPDLLKALWENVPEQTLQEISDAIWGQVSSLFVNFKVSRRHLQKCLFPRLVWTLPGKTKIVCHLKDKKKIRNKKRLGI